MKTTHCPLLLFLVAALAGNSWIPAALANNPPTLSPLVDLAISEDTGDHLVPLSGIGSGAPEELQILIVSATSSNPSLIPAPAIQYVSPNANGTLVFRPAVNAFGTATITVTVNDGQPSDNIVTRSFNVIVAPVNDLPTISVIEDRVVDENQSTGPIPFVVSDVETPAASLIVAASSSNPTLIPAANLVIGGSGNNRTLTVIPAPNLFGSATISVNVADAAGATARSEFLVTVNAQMQIKMAEKSPIVIWSATNAVLQHRGEQGEWEDMQPAPTSPYSVQPSGIKFYRLRKR
jgi:hypothetical protein